MANTGVMTLGNTPLRLTKPLKIVLALAMAFFFLFASTGTSFAAGSNAKADAELQTYVYTQIGPKTYQLSGGGTLVGTKLFTGSGANRTVDADSFAKLTGKAQSQFVNDLVTANKKAYDPKSPKAAQKTTNVTQETSENWLRTLQATPGVGSKLLNEVLSGTQPDFVTGQKIFAPFQGPLSTAMGFLAIIMMSLFALTIVIDLLYIVVPMARVLVEKAGGGENKGGGGAGSFLVTNEAISAVREAEGNSDGGARSALGTYFKRRAISMFILGLLLLYLVQGRIWSLVGTFMDLSAGIL